MAKSSAIIRTYMKLMENPYVGPQSNNPNISYSSEPVKSGANKGEIGKVIASLRSYESGKYTRLAQNIKKMQEIANETVKLEQQIRADAREAIADLFHAEDAAYTRVVETVSFTLQITKDPKPAVTVRYSEVLKELEEHLTPELITVLESIKQKFSTVNAPKAAALTYSAKSESKTDSAQNAIVETPVLDKLKSFFSKYLNKILSWGESYDAKLADLKAKVGLKAESMKVTEAPYDGSFDDHRFSPNRVARTLFNSLADDDMTNHNGVVPLGNGPKGATVTVKTDDDSVFEISVKQIS